MSRELEDNTENSSLQDNEEGIGEPDLNHSWYSATKNAHIIRQRR